jgi:hypothetical protein
MRQNRWTLDELHVELARFEQEFAGRSAEGVQHPHLHRADFTIPALAGRGLRAEGADWRLTDRHLGKSREGLWVAYKEGGRRENVANQGFFCAVSWQLDRFLDGLRIFCGF